MKSVWVIEDGEYSDYHVVGVFTLRENAERVLQAVKVGRDYSSPTIAEWPLDPAAAELNAGMTQWSVHMLKDGSTERVHQLERLDEYGLGGEPHVWERTKAPAYRGKGIPDILNGIVWAKDKEHAVKIMNEHRLGMIAAGKF